MQYVYVMSVECGGFNERVTAKKVASKCLQDFCTDSTGVLISQVSNPWLCCRIRMFYCHPKNTHMWSLLVGGGGVGECCL